MAKITRHSPLAHSAYSDLVSLLRDEAVSNLRGTPTRVERGGRTYWYDSYRVGRDVKKRFLGVDEPELRKRIEAHRELKTASEARRASLTRLVRILRAEGFMGLDAASAALIAAFAKAGVFRLGGVLVGTHAFRLYEGELGLRYRVDQAAATRDIDIASFERLSLALQDDAPPQLEQVMADFSFAPAPSLEAGRTWRWQQGRGETLVEFLTPSFEEGEGLKDLPALGVSAQSLHHLNYLIADPIPAALLYRSGVFVQIPRPERFAIHKLIVADRRREETRLKSEKDRQQASFLIAALAEDRPDELLEAYLEAESRGPRWRKRLEASLDRLPEIRVVLEGLRTSR